MKTLEVVIVLAALGFIAAVGFGYVKLSVKATVDQQKVEQTTNQAKEEGAKQLNKALENLKVK